jgi:flagellin
MTVINTNVSSLVAKSALQANSTKLSTAMERLSTGVRINSSKDDAAGLAISSRMDAQIRGLNMAVRNANDGISLMQTTEGSLSEVTNMLQRMRELAVQSVNGANNDTDRNSLDSEVQQLKAEIDRIATTTQFNNQNVLDGSFKNKQFQIGDKAGSNIAVSISSVKTKDLGLGSGTGVSDTLVSNRIAIADIGEGDVLINGQAIGEIDSATDDMEDIILAINENVDNVKASGFNVVTAQQIGTGVTSAGELTISVQELGQTTATTFAISESNSLSELVANINAEAGGVVKAEVNAEGKLQLSNSTGATITIDDGGASDNDSYDGGSGFANRVGGTDGVFTGFLKLESTDGSSVRITRGNLGLTAPGDQDDLESLGFRETSKTTLSDAYTVTGIALADNDAVEEAWGLTDIKINGVQIYDSNIDSTSFQGKLDTINALSSETGVTASAYFEQTFDTSTTYSGTEGDNDFYAEDLIWVNGVSVELGNDIDELVENINDQTALTGIAAKANGANLVLSGDNVKSLTLTATNSTGDNDQEGDNIYLGLTNVTMFNDSVTTFGAIRLNSINNSPISIELGDGENVDTHGFLEMNVGAADFEVNKSTLGSGSGKSIAGMNISSQASANDAIIAIDRALESVSGMRAEMGAIQNRLEYTISNLTNVSTNTSASRSRILDTDYAAETSNLAKAQIISQAATAMLAQANQSAQSVLALLK